MEKIRLAKAQAAGIPVGATAAQLPRRRQDNLPQGGGSLTVPDGVKSVFLKATDYSPTR